MPEERDEAITFSESDEIDWRQYLYDFREKVWPVFEEQGFTFAEALSCWRQEVVVNRITQLLDEIRGT